MPGRMALMFAVVIALAPGTRALADQEPAAMAGMLAAHNAARREAGVPALQWADTLAASAQRWADSLRGGGCNMRHSGAHGLGENLAWASGQSLSAAQVVGMWVGEKCDFDAARNVCAPNKVCGHYTQVVWRSTSLVGCAMATCGKSEVWVCQYTPPGNYVGQRPF